MLEAKFIRDTKYFGKHSNNHICKHNASLFHWHRLLKENDKNI